MLLQFAAANWYLFVMLGVIVLLLTLSGSRGARKVSPMQLPGMQARRSAVVVDVCAEDAYKKGHIEQSINLPLGQFGDKLAKLNKHKSKPIILACHNGTLSPRAASILRRNDFGELYILEGGLAAWKKENLPLVKN